MALIPAERQRAELPIERLAEHAAGQETLKVNERLAPRIAKLFISFSIFSFKAHKPSVIPSSTEDTEGFVAVDAVQLVLAKMNCGIESSILLIP